MTASRAASDLDLYEIAFLAGGPDRVVDTALVALVESGRVRVHAPGELAVVQPARRHPVEAAVMDAVGTRGHRSIDTVRWRLTGDDRLADLGRSLGDAGLLRRRFRLGRRDVDRPAWFPTGSGRQALLEVTEKPPTDPAMDGGSAHLVALHGRQAMPDARLRAAIFERPAPPPVATGGLRRRRREAEDGDPALAAHRTQIALGGAAGLGFLEGGMGDGGGF